MPAKTAFAPAPPATPQMWASPYQQQPYAMPMPPNMQAQQPWQAPMYPAYAMHRQM